MLSLYECQNAIIKDGKIVCQKGHDFMTPDRWGPLDILRLARGAPLIFQVCQDCPDFDRNGPPVPKSERGWLKKRGKLELSAEDMASIRRGIEDVRKGRVSKVNLDEL